MKTNATPHEKAKLIFNKFYKAMFLCETTKELGKVCAQITVDEILLNMFNTAYDIEDVNHPLIRFWNNVKTEIEKL